MEQQEQDKILETKINGEFGIRVYNRYRWTNVRMYAEIQQLFVKQIIYAELMLKSHQCMSQQPF